VQSNSSMRHWLLGFITGSLLFGFSGRLLAQSPPDAAELVATRLEALETERARLHESGDVQAAEQLAKQLSDARAILAGDLTSASTEQVELHAVGIAVGGAAPPGVLHGKDRFVRGYAEVSVTHTSAPLLLFVGAVERTHFRFNVDAGVRLVAVIFGGRYTPSYTGLPEGTLILQRAADAPDGLGFVAMSYGDAGYEGVSNVLREFTGRELLTTTAAQKYTGTPLVVGPANPAWRAQYVLSSTEAAHEKALDVIRAKAIAKLADLRFRGLYYQASSQHGHDGLASEGEFTIAGPLAESLRPIDKGIRHLVHEPKNQLDFGITHHTEFVVVEPNVEEYAKVPLDAAMPREVRFNTLAHDTKRDRFILTGRDDQHPIYAYNLSDSTWKLLRKQGPNLSSLIYVPDKDELIGVTVVDHHGEEARGGATVCRLSPEGETIELFRPNQDIRDTWGDFGGTTLAYRDNQLVIASPPSRDSKGAYESHVHVVDLNSREVLFSGPSVPHDGRNAPKLASVDRRPSGTGIVHRLFDRLELADATVKSLREEGRTEQADAMEKRVSALRDRLAGKWEPLPEAKARLHLISGYSAGSVTVEVTAQPEPVILALGSYEPASWTIRMAQGAKLERVILGGYHRQTLAEVPAGVAVENYSHDDGSVGFYVSSRNDESYAPALHRLRELTGLTPTTFQGIGRGPQSPLTIGPENHDWLIQVVVEELDAELKSALADRQAAKRQLLSHQRFQGVYRTFSPNARPHESGSLEIGEFSVRGPLPHTLWKVPDRYEQATIDATSGDVYFRRGDELLRYEAATGASSRIEWDATLPDLSWPSAIAFDTKRNRLLLNSFGGGGYLYAYDIKQEKWSVICRPGLSTNAMIYVPELDAIFAANLSMGGEGVHMVRKFNAHGALLETLSFPAPLRSERHRGPHPLFDLAYFEGHVAILGPTVPDPLAKDVMLPEIHVLDLNTREMVYEGLLRPHPGSADLSPQQLAELWTLLGDPKHAEAEKAVWQMAAGSKPTVEFIVQNLRPVVPPDEAAVREWIQQLDSEDFATREAAQTNLAAQGRAITPLLEAEREHSSAEVRASIQRLLRAANGEIPQSPELARDVRAAKVLELIATPEAVKALELIASGPPNLERTAAAKASLERLSSSVQPAE
jgi:hypothetical protein